MTYPEEPGICRCAGGHRIVATYGSEAADLCLSAGSRVSAVPCRPPLRPCRAAYDQPCRQRHPVLAAAPVKDVQEHLSGPGALLAHRLGDGGQVHQVRQPWSSNPIIEMSCGPKGPRAAGCAGPRRPSRRTRRTPRSAGRGRDSSLAIAHLPALDREVPGTSRLGSASSPADCSVSPVSLPPVELGGEAHRVPGRSADQRDPLVAQVDEVLHRRARPRHVVDPHARAALDVRADQRHRYPGASPAPQARRRTAAGRAPAPRPPAAAAPRRRNTVPGPRHARGCTAAGPCRGRAAPPRRR